MSLPSEIPQHSPVLSRAATAYIDPGPTALLVETNFGDGAYTEVLLNAAPQARIVAFELDPDAVRRAAGFLGPDRLAQVTVLMTSFGNLERELTALGIFGQVDGLVCDPGLSIKQARGGASGFSFQSEGPLLMSYDPNAPLTAAVLVNERSAVEIAAIFEGGDVQQRDARKVAEAIVERRRRAPLQTTTDLVETIIAALGRTHEGKRHVATRYFLGLRLAVTNELGELERAMPAMLGCLKLGGVGVLLAYHGGESRLQRQFLQQHKQRKQDDGSEGPRLEVLTKDPVRPEREEVRRNPAARSALLRAFRRVA